MSLPYLHSGYLSEREMFDILLLESPGSANDLLDEGEDADVKKAYRTFLMNHSPVSPETHEILDARVTKSDMLFGPLTNLFYETDREIAVGSLAFSDLYVYTKDDLDKLVRHPFLQFSSDEDLETAVRNFIFSECHQDFTRQNPQVNTSYFEAVRPPLGDFGLRIFGRKGALNG